MQARPAAAGSGSRRIVASSLLLALEGLLLLSERFQWFAFNRHKGWTVLDRRGGRGRVLAADVPLVPRRPGFRLRFQFSIRSLLLLTVVVAVACSWLAAEMERARKQRETVEEIEKAGGTVSYDYQLDPYGDWDTRCQATGTSRGCEKLLGDDLFVNVTEVSFAKSAISDAGLEHLKGLTQLQRLDLRGTKVSDAGLEHLKGLTQLQRL